METAHSPATAPAKPASRFRPRRMDFPFGDDVPGAWSVDKVTTLFMNAVSCAFPSAEDFFVKEIREARPMIRDAALAEAARAFCGQEANHAYEHRKLNRLLFRRHPGLEAHEQRMMRIIKFLQRRPLRQRLAVIAAVEHLTSILSEALLSGPQRWVSSDCTCSALFIWHAIEEIEHKAVAFDVHRHLGGSHGVRAINLLVFTLVIGHHFFAMHMHLLRSEGLLWKFSTWRRLASMYLGRHGVVGLTWRNYLKFFKPGFHPNDIPDGELPSRWAAAWRNGDPMHQVQLGQLFGRAKN